VVRILHLLRELDRLGGCDLYELATHYGTTTRTVRRDLEAIEAAGIPLKKEPGEGSKVRWSLDTQASQRLTTLVETTHFMALKLAMNEGLALKRQSLLFASLEDLSDRIETAIGKKGRAQLQAIDQSFFSWDKFAWRNAPLDVVVPLVDAITERRRCEVTYRAPSSGNKANTFSILPLRLFVHHGALYLHAWQPKHQTVLPLNLHRLIELKVGKEVMAMPEGYDPAKLEATAFGIFIGPKAETFELRFDAFARPYIEERQWHPTQRLEAQGDGSVMLSFECAPSYEVTNWVASWREHVQVVRPLKLRAELLNYGAWLLSEYTSAPPQPARAGAQVAAPAEVDG
jgi:predicted DNA-binding transcriptional regulator YafY